MDDCTCGHARNEHEPVGSTCTVDGCECVEYEWFE